MSVKIGSNNYSLLAQRSLADVVSSLSKSYERLSSGQRINRASDDSAGLAVSSALNVRSRVYTQALRNGNDAISELSIADGALSQMGEIVTRMKELAEQSSNSVYTSTQRSALQQEVNSLCNEYNRIVGSTVYNGRSVFNPDGASTKVQLGFGSDELLGYSVGAAISRTVTDYQFGSTAFTPTGVFQAAADFNNDGKTDFITYGASRQRLNLSQGNGSFSASIIFIGPDAAYAWDMDHDGNQDLLVGATSGSQTYYFLKGNGDGTFSNQLVQTFGFSAMSENVGDYNGDGLLDSMETGGSCYYLRFGNGNFSFSGVQVTANQSIGTFNGGIVNDVNGDGRSDITNLTGAYLSNGDGTFTRSQSWALGGVDAVTDVNGDGKSDVISTSGASIKVFLGNGNGTFGSSISTTTAASKSWLSTGDFDADGKTDVLFSDSSNSAQVYIGQGNGTFAASGITAGSTGSGFAGDFNGDGFTDYFSGTAAHLEETYRSDNIANVDISTATAALKAIDAIESLLQKNAAERGQLGAMQSRITTAISMLQSTTDNYSAASARITDADIAQESASMLRSQILQQAASAVLAQANQQPGIALKLLTA